MREQRDECLGAWPMGCDALKTGAATAGSGWAEVVAAMMDEFAYLPKASQICSQLQ